MTNSDNVPAVGIEATAYGSIAAPKNYDSRRRTSEEGELDWINL